MSMSDNYDYSTKAAANINPNDSDSIVAQKIYDLQNPTSNTTNPNQFIYGGDTSGSSGKASSFFKFVGIVSLIAFVGYFAISFLQFTIQS